MAKGKKTGGRNFVKGVVTNPKGRPPEDPEYKKLKNYTKEKIVLLMNKVMGLNLLEMKAIIANPETDATELAFIKIMSETIRTGDYSRLNFYLDRTIGPIAKNLVLTGPNGEPLIPTEHIVVELKDGKPFKQHTYKGS